MSEIIFITGGARNGKSRLAEELAQSSGALHPDGLTEIDKSSHEAKAKARSDK